LYFGWILYLVLMANVVVVDVDDVDDVDGGDEEALILIDDVVLVVVVVEVVEGTSSKPGPGEENANASTITDGCN